MKVFYSLFFVLLFLSFAFGQDKVQDNNTYLDSIKVKPFYKASLNELKQVLFSNSFIDPYTVHVNKQVNKIISDNYVYKSSLNSLPEKNEDSFNLAKNNMLGAIRLQPKFLPANELGILGDILIYTNAAAAGYALYMHLKKYKDEY